MFDKSRAAVAVDAVTTASREKNAACGRELIAIGDMYAAYAPEDEHERECWAIDGHANLVAEIGAAMNISRGRASGQLEYAITLRERLPKVAEVFAQGDIDYRMMIALVKRTDNVDDAQLAKLDAALARWAPKWMKMSGPKLDERIDMWITKFDPDGVREPREPQQDRYVDVRPLGPGMAGIWAKVEMKDGIAIDDALDAIANTVCRDDPRTQSQRRADAIVARFAGATALECRCGSDDCPMKGTAHEPLAQVVIQVMTEQATLTGDSEDPGYVSGYGAVPAEQLREWATTAKVQPVVLPPACAESGYRPSAALARFVRCRDLTCRFPGCDAPAAACEIDHTIAYPLGPTHPSNLKLLCVFHHLLKTFWVGPGGWADRQAPDGTVVWTSPSGKEYTTTPGGALFFPILATPTGEFLLPPRGGGFPAGDRGRMMPTRRRSRAQDKAYRIALERQHNAERLQREHQLRAQELARSYEPPPF